MKDIGTRLKKLRERENKSQRDFSKILEVSQQTISKWERGKLPIPVRVLVKLVDRFDVDMNYFYPTPQRGVF